MSAREIIRDLINRHHTSSAERAYNEHEEGADRIIAALSAAGFVIVPLRAVEAARVALEEARGALSYLRTQAQNGALHPQVVIQNAAMILDKSNA